MEFKVIFVGFALHCVLNVVLISKSVITNAQSKIIEVAIVSEEKKMLNSLSGEASKMKFLSLHAEPSTGEGIVAAE